MAVKFKCPYCGSENCDRKVNGQRVDDRHFWQGNYRCSDCGAEKDKDGPFYYASDCFVVVRKESEVITQLTLF